MKYSVVHSNDPWLLARLATDFELITGLQTDDRDELNPFFGDKYWACDSVATPYFLNHEGVFDPVRYELTDENYISVLTKILEP